MRMAIMCSTACSFTLESAPEHPRSPRAPQLTPLLPEVSRSMAHLRRPRQWKRDRMRTLTHDLGTLRLPLGRQCYMH